MESKKIEIVSCSVVSDSQYEQLYRMVKVGMKPSIIGTDLKDNVVYMKDGKLYEQNDVQVISYSMKKKEQLERSLFLSGLSKDEANIVQDYINGIINEKEFEKAIDEMKKAHEKEKQKKREQEERKNLVIDGFKDLVIDIIKRYMN